MKKKQPTKMKVQLSKEDLVELLTVLKNFIQEELLQKEKETERLASIDRHRMRARITHLEMFTKAQEIKRISYCDSHENKLVRISYSKLTGRFCSADYRCSRCGGESRKIWCFLPKKEKKALRTLGVTL